MLFKYRRQHLRAIKKSKFSILLRTLLAIPQKSQEPNLWRVIIFCFIPISTFGSFKNPSTTNTGLSELGFKCWRFVLLVETKEVISMSYGSSISSWKSLRSVRLGTTFMMRDIYINSNLDPITKFTRSKRSSELKDIHPRNLFEMIAKTVPINTRIKIVAWHGASPVEFEGKPGEKT